MESGESVAQQLTTIRDYIRWAVTRFNKADIYFGHGTDNAMDEALRLVLFAVGIPLGSQADFLDAKLTGQERLAVLALIDQRVEQRMPLPYLLGEAWFAGLSFKVDSRVLIPRSPVAELIQQGFEPWLPYQAVGRILDLCTGGGCIGIACAHYFAEASVDLADLSEGALEVANENITSYELNHRVKTVQSDLFNGLAGQQYQLIVSNPPYVDSEDLAAMPAEYQHEPAMALGSGDDGLDITRRILKQAANYLTDKGLLVVEVGNSGIALEQAYPDVPFTWIEFEQGGHGVFIFSKAELLEYFRTDVIPAKAGN
ncbi:MAG: 50S ribosomal protein L3 N(5)-glutamine methyltransferase [Oceanicoccus sp.]|uniref:50S ribosomal protein L3 N(5)-glutamine methyltransferase n=1 Tax=Oceanicoccus sp. TaxID=2691044 RepID=UPI002621F14D|nr:50S ribosomal protein L3 N(5)-glutamine methyltransferase [Oceanicoccus sp.]MCP3906985.1 50S ribosomal protein L3 N(5)-glutamine methyltransferase [Oceanicoccus sp.]MDG1772019.1 50S ribosomal protein L3 N(5)-glutamine methyltransferase [Oceanicoccus sp.]